VAYVRQANMMRRGGSEQEQDVESEGNGQEVVLLPERYAELSAHEEFVLTVSENGYGKRTSAYEYRISGRGGKGIIAMTVNQRNGKLIGSFPVEEGDQIMLVTDRGQLIRIPVEGISGMGRSTQGVIVFDTAEGERVVSVEHIPDVENGNGEEGHTGDGPLDDGPEDESPQDEGPQHEDAEDDGSSEES
jgi:DNA gyrase subunit A